MPRDPNRVKPPIPPAAQRPKKVHVEPQTNAQQWEAIESYLAWFDELPTDLQSAAIHYEKIRGLRRG